MKEVTITRTLDAPRALVFQAWIDPRHLAQWWGPHTFTTPVCEVDARPGGAIRLDMRGPAGTEFDKIFPNRGEFKELIEPERIVFTLDLFNDDGKPIIETLVSVTLADRAGKTEMTLHARVLRSAPQAAGHLEGMHEGWNQSLERFAGLVENVKA